MAMAIDAAADGKDSDEEGYGERGGDDMDPQMLPIVDKRLEHMHKVLGYV